MNAKTLIHIIVMLIATSIACASFDVSDRLSQRDTNSDTSNLRLSGHNGVIETAVITGLENEETEITYEVIDGLAIYNERIVLGRVEELDRTPGAWSRAARLAMARDLTASY